MSSFANLRIRTVVVVTVILVFSYAVLSKVFSSGDDSAQVLAKAQEALGQSKPEKAKDLLKLKASRTAFPHWVIFYQGMTKEALGDLSGAYALYDAVPADSAASLDAKLGLLRLKDVQPNRDYGALLAALELELTRADREDLRPQLLLLRAREAEKNNSIALALSIYAQLRQSYTNTPEAVQAKKNYDQIFSTHALDLGEISVAEHIAEAKRLLGERDLDHALERVHNAKAMVTKGSSAYYDILLVESDILREKNRGQEADHMLAQIAQDGTLGTADLAYFQIAKAAWNKHDDLNALEALQAIIHKYPSSSKNDEARYLAGRVLEDLGKPAAAREVYITLAQSAAGLTYQAQATRRIAWTFLATGNYQTAAQYFEKAGNYALDGLRKARAKTYTNESESDSSEKIFDKPSDLQYEYEHSLYWQGYSMKNANNPGYKDSLESVIDINPAGYYAQEARLLLGVDADLGLPALAGECFNPTDENLNKTLDGLNSGKLRALIAHEIDWHYKLEEAPAPLFDVVISKDSDLKNVATRMKLYTEHSLPNLAIDLGTKVTSQLGQTYQKANYFPCANSVRALSFPMAFRSEIVLAAESAKIDPALLFGITRTESHFDPEAQSRTGAKGLAQLMPQTATEVGLKADQNIFEPSLNLKLGATYLAKLLDRFQRNDSQAIAAYNAGADSVSRWLSKDTKNQAEWIESITFSETRDYVKKVIAAKRIYAQLLSRTAAKKR